MMFRTQKLSPDYLEDFFKVHSKENSHELCNCVAWWVPTWGGWDERTPEQNRALREELFRQGEFDGYLLYEDNLPIGWCQVFPKHRLSKLSLHFPSNADSETFSVSCLFIVPEKRRSGMAALLLNKVLIDLKARGVGRVEAYPKPKSDLPDEDAWLGPYSLFMEAGFHPLNDQPESRILVKEL